MDNVAQAAVAYRFQLRNSIDELKQLSTGLLSNGALCFVNDNGALYQYAKYSSLAADDNVVLAPADGAGRWLLFTVANALSLPAFVQSVAGTTFVTHDGTWQPVVGTGALTLILAPDPAPSWTFAAAGCVLTYAGEPATYIAELVATLAQVGGAAGNCLGAIAKNSDTVGAATLVGSGAQAQALAATDTGQVIKCIRQIELVPGDTVAPRFAAAVGVLATISALNFSVRRA